MTTAALGQRRSTSLVGLSSWAVIVGAILQLVLIPLAYLEAETPPPAPIVALNILNHVLLMAGLVGLAQSHAAGRGWVATVGLSLSQLGFAVLVIAEASWLFSAGLTEALFGLATLALLIGLTLTGVAVISARRWTGWRRFTPLACGVFLVAVLFSFALPGYASNYAIGLWGVCWLLFGFALRTEGAS